MINETNKYLRMFEFKNKVLCLHSKFKLIKMILSNITNFKTHIAKIHKIFLRE